MGTDIHIFVERFNKKTNKWENINMYYKDNHSGNFVMDDGFELGRDYIGFARLANVRGYDSKCVDTEPGWPDDISRDTMVAVIGDENKQAKDKANWEESRRISKERYGDQFSSWFVNEKFDPYSYAGFHNFCWLDWRDLWCYHYDGAFKVIDEFNIDPELYDKYCYGEIEEDELPEEVFRDSVGDSIFDMIYNISESNPSAYGLVPWKGKPKRDEFRILICFDS